MLFPGVGAVVEDLEVVIRRPSSTVSPAPLNQLLVMLTNSSKYTIPTRTRRVVNARLDVTAAKRTRGTEMRRRTGVKRK